MSSFPIICWLVTCYWTTSVSGNNLVFSYSQRIHSSKMAASEQQGGYALPEPARTCICALGVSMPTRWALVRITCFSKWPPKLITDVPPLSQGTYFKVTVCEFIQLNPGCWEIHFQRHKDYWKWMVRSQIQGWEPKNGKTWGTYPILSLLCLCLWRVGSIPCPLLHLRVHRWWKLLEVTARFSTFFFFLASDGGISEQSAMSCGQRSVSITVCSLIICLLIAASSQRDTPALPSEA